VPDRCACGQEGISDSIAPCRHHFVVADADGAAHAEALPDDGLQVGELLGLLERDRGVSRDAAARDGVPDLVLKTRVGARARGEVHNGGRQGRRCCLGSCKYLQAGFPFNLALCESVANKAALYGQR